MAKKIDFNENRDAVKVLDDKIAENDSFKGETLIPEKEQRFNEMRQICREIAERDKYVKNNFIPFSRENRHAIVQLRLPEVYASYDKSVSPLLAKLYTMADHVHMSAIGERGGIVLSFTVADMWE